MTIQGLSNTGSAYPPSGVDNTSPSVNLPLVTGYTSGGVTQGSSAGASSPSAVAQPATGVQAGQGRKAKQPQQNSAAQVKSAVDSLNQSMQSMNRDLTFSVDQSTKKMVVKVVEAQTGTVIAQIPSKQALAIAQSIDSSQQGLLLQEKA